MKDTALLWQLFREWNKFSVEKASPSQLQIAHQFQTSLADAMSDFSNTDILIIQMLKLCDTELNTISAALISEDAENLEDALEMKTLSPDGWTEMLTRTQSFLTLYQRQNRDLLQMSDHLHRILDSFKRILQHVERLAEENDKDYKQAIRLLNELIIFVRYMPIFLKPDPLLGRQAAEHNGVIAHANGVPALAGKTAEENALAMYTEVFGQYLQYYNIASRKNAIPDFFQAHPNGVCIEGRLKGITRKCLEWGWHSSENEAINTLKNWHDVIQEIIAEAPTVSNSTVLHPFIFSQDNKTHYIEKIGHYFLGTFSQDYKDLDAKRITNKQLIEKVKSSTLEHVPQDKKKAIEDILMGFLSSLGLDVPEEDPSHTASSASVSATTRLETRLFGKLERGNAPSRDMLSTLTIQDSILCHQDEVGHVYPPLLHIFHHLLSGGTWIKFKETFSPFFYDQDNITADQFIRSIHPKTGKSPLHVLAGIHEGASREVAYFYHHFYDTGDQKKEVLVHQDEEKNTFLQLLIKNKEANEREIKECLEKIIPLTENIFDEYDLKTYETLLSMPDKDNKNILALASERGLVTCVYHLIQILDRTLQKSENPMQLLRDIFFRENNKEVSPIVLAKKKNNIATFLKLLECGAAQLLPEEEKKTLDVDVCHVLIHEKMSPLSWRLKDASNEILKTGLSERYWYYLYSADLSSTENFFKKAKLLALIKSLQSGILISESSIQLLPPPPETQFSNQIEQQSDQILEAFQAWQLYIFSISYYKNKMEKNSLPGNSQRALRITSQILDHKLFIGIINFLFLTGLVFIPYFLLKKIKFSSEKRSGLLELLVKGCGSYNGHWKKDLSIYNFEKACCNYNETCIEENFLYYDQYNTNILTHAFLILSVVFMSIILLFLFIGYISGFRISTPCKAFSHVLTPQEKNVHYMQHPIMQTALLHKELKKFFQVLIEKKWIEQLKEALVNKLIVSEEPLLREEYLELLKLAQALLHQYKLEFHYASTLDMVFEKIQRPTSEVGLNDDELPDLEENIEIIIDSENDSEEESLLRGAGTTQIHNKMPCSPKEKLSQDFFMA